MFKEIVGRTAGIEMNCLMLSDISTISLWAQCMGNKWGVSRGCKQNTLWRLLLTAEIS